MKELLEKWAELEPKQCHKDPLNPATYYLLGASVNVISDLNVHELGVVQMATQQAIEARGWLWSLSRPSGIGYVPWTATVRRFTLRSYGSPAEALLSAYLLALEAVKTQEVQA